VRRKLTDAARRCPACAEPAHGRAWRLEQTLRQKPPPGFQRAESLLERGMLDRIVPRQELRATLAALLGLLT